MSRLLYAPATGKLSRMAFLANVLYFVKNLTAFVSWSRSADVKIARGGREDGLGGSE